MGLSPDALRLLARICRRTAEQNLQRLVPLVTRGCFDKGRPPIEVIKELETARYLKKTSGGWTRTERKYTEKMRLRLARLAQRRKQMDSSTVLAKPVPDMPPEVARWLGYPTQETRQTGRVHYIEDE